MLDCRSVRRSCCWLVWRRRTGSWKSRLDARKTSTRSSRMPIRFCFRRRPTKLLQSRKPRLKSNWLRYNPSTISSSISINFRGKETISKQPVKRLKPSSQKSSSVKSSNSTLSWSTSWRNGFFPPTLNSKHCRPKWMKGRITSTSLRGRWSGSNSSSSRWRKWQSRLIMTESTSGSSRKIIANSKLSCFKPIKKKGSSKLRSGDTT